MTRPAGYYVGLIQPEHADKPNFVATVDLTTQPYLNLQALLESMPQAFDVDYAVGVQLDAVGERVGISRNVSVPIFQGFFSWDTLNRGWDQSLWQGPYAQQFGIQAFDDDVYRQLVRAKIEANSGDGSVASALQILDTFFDGTSFTYGVYSIDRGAQGVPDCQPEMTVFFSGALPPIPYMLVVSREYLPLRPAGATFDCVCTSVPGAPIFGWDMDNEYMAGWDTGAWSGPPETFADNGVI